jgi:hypothetical protein
LYFSLQLPRISELHYRNKGNDKGQFIEIAHNASIADYKIYLYDGDTSIYFTIYLLNAPSLVNTVDGVTYSVFDVPDIEYAEDQAYGIELSDSAEKSIHFVSYNGIITYFFDGYPQGTSVDIGVKESDNTPVGASLQLINEVWTVTNFNTMGYPNSAVAPPTVPRCGLLRLGIFCPLTLNGFLARLWRRIFG